MIMFCRFSIYDNNYVINNERQSESLELLHVVIFYFSLSVEEINTALDAIAQANVEKERDAAKSTILKVIRSTSALEQKWFIRIMLKVKL